MKVRRVVTGHTPDGKAIFASDTEVEPITVKLAPGVNTWRLWEEDETVTLPTDGSVRLCPTIFPPPGGFRFGIFTVPPLTDLPPEDIDLQAEMIEMERKMPGFAAHMEPDNPGMHTTDTIDFEYIISGEVWLELDDGKEVHLRAGDTVVQNGTRHAWRNKGSEPCLMVLCTIGANRR